MVAMSRDSPLVAANVNWRNEFARWNRQVLSPLLRSRFSIRRHRPSGASLVTAPADHLETTIGLNWINRIAVVTLLLGAAFLFKYGVDNDWFGPGVRVALGIAAGIISLLAGDRVWRRGQTVFAQGVIGLGVALLYLSIYAAAILYQLIPPSLAFVAMGGITGGAVGLAVLYNSQAIAVLALAGGYLTPPALSTGEDHPWILFGYVFLLNIGALLLARMRRWSALEPIAAAATIILYAGWLNRVLSDATLSDADRPVATMFAFAFYAQFSVAKFPQLWAVFQLTTSIALAVIWKDSSRFVWWNLPLVAVGLLRTEMLAPLLTLACFWLPYRFWYSTDAPFAALSAAFLLLFAWALWRTPDRAPGLGLIAANAAIYYAASYTLLNPAHHQYMGLLAATVGGVHLPLARRFEPHSDSQNLRLGVALAFVTLAVPIQFAGFRITVAWALEGAALAWLAARSPNRWLRQRLLDCADARDRTPPASRHVPLLAKLRILDVAEYAFPHVRRLHRGPLAIGEISGPSNRCGRSLYRRARGIPLRTEP